MPGYGSPLGRPSTRLSTHSTRTPRRLPLSGPHPASRARLPRARERWRRAGLVATTLLTLAVLLMPSSPQVEGPGVPSSRGLPLAVMTRQSGLAAAAAEHRSPPAAQVLARFENVELVTLNKATRLVSFHEASYPDALPLAPVGRVVVNDNPTRFTASSEAEGPDYVVLSSRGRPNAATSALDVAVPSGTPIASVVTGTVGLVEPYLLYGRYPDTKVEIFPAARPDLRVVMIHLTDVRVVTGQRVVAGRTIVAGSANRFPFASQVDRYLGGDPGPHVHIEVKAPLLGPPPPSGEPPPPPPAAGPLG